MWCIIYRVEREIKFNILIKFRREARSTIERDVAICNARWGFMTRKARCQEIYMDVRNVLGVEIDYRTYN